MSTKFQNDCHKQSLREKVAAIGANYSEYLPSAKRDTLKGQIMYRLMEQGMTPEESGLPDSDKELYRQYIQEAIDDVVTILGIEYRISTTTELEIGDKDLTKPPEELSKLINLKELDVSWNRYLTSLDVSVFGQLEDLRCEGNKLTELDISNNTHLNLLNCSFNQITELDITNNKKLEYLYCERNKLVRPPQVLANRAETIEEIRQWLIDNPN